MPPVKLEDLVQSFVQAVESTRDDPDPDPSGAQSPPDLTPVRAFIESLLEAAADGLDSSGST